MPKKTPAKSVPATPIANNPDWSYWGNLATVRMREALQLSFGLNPHTHVPSLEKDLTLLDQYHNRLLISKNHAPEADWIVERVVREEGDISAEYTEVYLKKFVDWMVNETTLEIVSEEFKRLALTQADSRPAEPTIQSVTPTRPIYLLVNGDPESDFYYARQPLSVLEDLVKHHGGTFTAAAKALHIERQHLSRVINNLRAGRRAWADN